MSQVMIDDNRDMRFYCDCGWFHVDWFEYKKHMQECPIRGNPHD